MSDKMSKADREQMYTDFLRTEGYRPDQNQDENVVFMKSGAGYVITVLDDADYFCLLLPAFWPIESEEERIKAQRAAQTVNAETKVAKVYFHEDEVWAAVQLFCVPPESFRPVFGRCMSVLEHAVEHFVKLMKA